MAKILLGFILCVFLPLADAEDVEEIPKDPAIVQMCVKRDFYIQCDEGMGVFISSNQVLTAYHVVSPVFQTNDSVKNVLFFRHPERPHIKVEFDKIVMASAIDDMAVLEVTDYISEDFYPLVKEGEENLFSVGEEVSLKRFPGKAEFPFISIPVIIINSNHDYITARLLYEYNLRGMSGGPVLVDNQLIGIVSRGSVSHAYIALIHTGKISRFEYCIDDHSCIEKSMQALQEEAANGNSVAQYLLSIKYRSGVEIEHDIVKASNLYNQALSNGYSEE